MIRPLDLVGMVAPFAPPPIICAQVGLTFREFVAAFPISGPRRIWNRLYSGSRSAPTLVRVTRDGAKILECAALIRWPGSEDTQCHVQLRADAMRHDVHAGDLLEIIALRWRLGRIT